MGRCDDATPADVPPAASKYSPMASSQLYAVAYRFNSKWPQSHKEARHIGTRHLRIKMHTKQTYFQVLRGGICIGARQCHKFKQNALIFGCIGVRLRSVFSSFFSSFSHGKRWGLGGRRAATGLLAASARFGEWLFANEKTDAVFVQNLFAV